MKIYLFVLILQFIYINSFSQTTIVLQPDAATGKDALIDTLYPIMVNDTIQEFNSSAWTHNGLFGIQRSLIDFDFSSIPSNATILSATLTLFNNPFSQNGFQNGEHSHVSGSNQSIFRKIISSWQPNTVTWNNQPATDTLHQVILPADTNPHQDYILNVTALIQDRIQNPTTSFGFMLKLDTEQFYRCLVFASSNHPDLALHPKLEITYIVESCISLTLQPNDIEGKDAIIDTLYPTMNNDTIREINTSAWTHSGLFGIQRSLIDFNFSSIPAYAIVQSATLTLYNNPNSQNGFQNGEHSHISGSNESILQRITSSWLANSVTWNNQPSTDTLHQVILQADTNPHQDYSLDVTDLIQDRVQNPSTTFGFMMKLQTEQYYRCLVFASSNHPNPSLHPKLEICYTVADLVNENNKPGMQINVFPNPAATALNLYINSPYNDFGKINIIDITGRKLMEDDIRFQKGASYYSFNIESFLQGSYLIVISGKNFRMVKKFFVD